MKHLVLFRHAKSRWDMGVNDRERDLEKIGIERAHKSAKYLRENLNFKLEAWQSSPAKRAQNTAQIAAEYFENPPELILNENLYTFAFFDLLKEVKKLDNSLQNVILFGHNEAFTEFVNRMGNHYIENLPTAGVAVIEFPVDDWKNIEKGTTQLIIKPKLL